MLRRLSERDHYEVLEVSYDASPEDIQKAYEEAREMYTHDALVSGSILSDQERRRTHECLAAAYQTLIAEDSRRIYDEMIGVRAPRAAGGALVSGPELELESELESESESERSASASPFNERGTFDDARRRSAASSTKQRLQAPAPRAASASVSRALGAGRLGEPGVSRPARLELDSAEEASGDFLRRARESIGLDLGTISQETKIGRSMLEYIEEERLDRLPAPIYLKNFTQQVAHCLGLDEERVARTYVERIRRLQSRSETGA